MEHGSFKNSINKINDVYHDYNYYIISCRFSQHKVHCMGENVRREWWYTIIINRHCPKRTGISSAFIFQHNVVA